MSENNIRKIIREALVQEDAQSTKEIENLSNDVLLLVSKKMSEQMNNRVMATSTQPSDINRYIALPPVFLKNVIGNTRHTYEALHDFITTSNLEIWLKYGFQKDSERGYYQPWGLYNEAIVTVYYGDEYRESVKDTIIKYASDYFDRPKGDEEPPFDYNDFYFDMFWAFNKAKTLQHELQHAYDDFRSKGKIFQNKQSLKYLNKYDGDRMDTNNKEQYQSYLKLPHEVWARFNQTIGKVNFWSIDRKEHEDGLKYTKKVMFDVKDVISDFTTNFRGWKILSDKVKKRLIKAVIGYWHLQQKEAKHFSQVAKAQAELSKQEKESELVSN